MLETALAEEKDNANSVTAIFKSVLPLVMKKEINDKNEFSTTIIDETAKHCRRILDKKYQAFKIIQSRNFSNISHENPIVEQKDSMYRMVMDSLPKFNRFVYILKHMYNYDVRKIADLLKTNTDVVNVILKSEEAHLSRIGYFAKELNDKLNPLNPEEFHKNLSNQKNTLAIPETTRSAVFQYAEKICAPIKEKEKKKKIKISVVGTILLIIAVIAAGICVGIGNSGENIIGGADVETDITISNDADVSLDYNEATDSGTTLNNKSAYYADIEIENYGTVTVALNSDEAPQTVENFVKLANEGFYDGLTFHRIMDGFMMQGGDPNGDGTGGSDENVVGEFSENGYENNISHTRGTISMARSNDYNSGSSQFFIVHEDSTFLDGQYAAFGHVTEGMDIVDEICSSSNPTDDNGTILADEQPVITTVTIR